MHAQKRSKTKLKPNAAQLFLACLLMLLGGWPRFCFGAVGLMVGLAISGAGLMALEVTIGLVK